MYRDAVIKFLNNELRTVHQEEYIRKYQDLVDVCRDILFKDLLYQVKVNYHDEWTYQRLPVGPEGMILTSVRNRFHYVGNFVPIYLILIAAHHYPWFEALPDTHSRPI